MDSMLLKQALIKFFAGLLVIGLLLFVPAGTISYWQAWLLIGEYDFVAKQLYQVEDPQTLLMDIAKEYQENEDLMNGVDSVYGNGSAQYIGKAIEAFYMR